MKRHSLIGSFFVLGILGAAIHFGWLTDLLNYAGQQISHQVLDNGQQQVINAFASEQSNLQVQVAAPVSRILPDDNQGSRHQRFILTLANGQTILVAHNIDLAPRVSGIAVGDSVTVAGEYEWNAKGGVIHWTHHDPSGSHLGGWIELKGNRYQ
jgi:hypothetical protein